MVLLPKHFDRFESAIQLNAGQRKRLDSAVDLVQSFAANDAGLAKYVGGEPFFQGSYAHNTLVRPLKEGREFDVDVTLPLDFGKFSAAEGKQTPEFILGYVAQRLRQHYINLGLPWNPPIVQRSKCIRINYAGEFHLDLVPMHFEKNRTLLADRRQGEFVRTNHPTTVTQWMADTDRTTEQMFKRAARIFKRWREFKFGVDSGPSSLHLTLLLGYALREMYSDGVSFNRWYPTNRTMDAFVVDAARAIKWFLTRSRFLSSPSIVIPGTEEDFYPRWPPEAHDLFLQRLDVLIENGEWGLQGRNAESSTTRWAGLLGPEFPDSA